MNQAHLISATLQEWVAEAEAEKKQAQECFDQCTEDDGGRSHFREDLLYLQGKLDGYRAAIGLCIPHLAEIVADVAQASHPCTTKVQLRWEDKHHCIAGMIGGVYFGQVYSTSRKGLPWVSNVMVRNRGCEPHVTREGAIIRIQQEAEAFIRALSPEIGVECLPFPYEQVAGGAE